MPPAQATVAYVETKRVLKERERQVTTATKRTQPAKKNKERMGASTSRQAKQTAKQSTTAQVKKYITTKEHLLKKIFVYFAACGGVCYWVYTTGQKNPDETCATADVLDTAWYFFFVLAGASVIFTALAVWGNSLLTRYRIVSFLKATKQLQGNTTVYTLAELQTKLGQVIRCPLCQTELDRDVNSTKNNLTAQIQYATHSTQGSCHIPLVGTSTFLLICCLCQDPFNIPDTHTRMGTRIFFRVAVLAYILASALYTGVILFAWPDFRRCGKSRDQFVAATLAAPVLWLLTAMMNLVETRNTRIALNPMQWLPSITEEFADPETYQKAMALHTKLIGEFDALQRNAHIAELRNELNKKLKASPEEINEIEQKINEEFFNSVTHKPTYRRILEASTKKT